ncbi:MAG: 1-acyl-sn-glycerol-3-phosphate acyltransferase [Salinivirgaceae bacterium]|jgi:1-acyl-sn-glycerol-3-phosphate acyltransferase|nr:1-acyl-sn-glycerol-3-phosphate acyltransferase [Salinivirgaceae bacterium]
MKKPIHEFDFWQNIVQNYVKTYIHFFYDKVTVVGSNKVPKDKPVILAINHQNALMDPLNVICALKGPSVFMARADVFKSEKIAKILRFFKMLPVFRIRDGIKSLQNNDAVFEEAISILEGKGRLGILPEGNHFGERKLRILKKGIARIAFQAEERNDFNLDVQIVPVGVDYTNYINFGADLLVHFGEPFSLSNFKDQYKENPQRGMNLFLQELREKMLPQMLHIEDSEHYDQIEALKNIYIQDLLAKRKLKDDHQKIIVKSQEISDSLIEYKADSFDEFEKLCKTALEIKDTVKEFGIRKWVVAQKRHYWLEIVFNYMLLAVLFPFFIYGVVANFLPFYIPVLVSRKIKDPQFVSSIRFSVAMATFLIFYLIYIILLLVFVKPWYLAIGIFISIFLFGILSFRYFIGFKKTWVKTKVSIWKIMKNGTWLNLKYNWDDTVQKLSEIIEK